MRELAFDATGKRPGTSLAGPQPVCATKSLANPAKAGICLLTCGRDGLRKRPLTDGAVDRQISGCHTLNHAV